MISLWQVTMLVSHSEMQVVHALSYPLGATFHVPHGEANYAMFTGVMNNYMEIKTDGEIEKLNNYIAGILGCDAANVYEELEKLMEKEARR